MGILSPKHCVMAFCAAYCTFFDHLYIWEEAKQLGYTTAVVEGACPSEHTSWYVLIVSVFGILPT